LLYGRKRNQERKDGRDKNKTERRVMSVNRTDRFNGRWVIRGCGDALAVS